MKTTKNHFNLFKKEVKKWVDIFELNDWQVYFKHKASKGVFGVLRTTLKGKVATFFFTQNWDDYACPLTKKNIKKTARHEATHLLLARFSCLASERYISGNELEEAEEEVVNKLVNHALEM